MRLIRDLDELHRASRDLALDEGLGGVLVPTMGALHDGHASLIRQGARLARAGSMTTGCVVTIFVNPTQFNDPRDFSRYPRTIDADLEICERAGASIVVVPGIETIYPPDETIETPPLPPVASEPGLEDAHRPGHFSGVCQVVLRLFRLLRPSAAVFGEKDWQQLQVIRAMTNRFAPRIEILPGPTVRSPDGLALSSRNSLLSAQDRPRALALSRALDAARRRSDPAAAEAAMVEVLAASGIDVEYAVVRDAETLLAITGPGPPSRARALVAGRVGGIRLIDNTAWPS